MYEGDRVSGDGVGGQPERDGVGGQPERGHFQAIRRLAAPSEPYYGRTPSGSKVIRKREPVACA